MFNTIGIQNFGAEIQDSTITILPGTARIGNALITFDGSRTHFEGITDFVGTGTEYQNTLLYLTDTSGVGVADMTISSSDVTSSLSALSSPVLSDSTTDYSFNFPLNEFTFESTDGTVNLLSHTKM